MVDIKSVNDIKKESEMTEFPFADCPDLESIGIFEDMQFSQLKLFDVPNEAFFFKKDIKTNLIKGLKSNISSKDDESLKSTCSPIVKESSCVDSDIISQVNVGNTPFTEKFMNSPYFKSVDNKRKSGLFDPAKLHIKSTNKSCDQYNRKGKKSGSNRLIKYIRFQHLWSGTKKLKRSDSDHYENEMKSLFPIFFYLNERTIILKVLDQIHFEKPNLEGVVNEKYISPYNNFHFYVTFFDIVKTDSYKGIRYYRARNRFDSELYCIKASTCNEDNIRSFNKSSRMLHTEILILSLLQHDNIVRYFSSWIEYQSLYEQIEYDSGGSLESAFHPFFKDMFEIRIMTIKAAKILVLQIGSALHYIHSQFKYVHNEVMDYNIFLFPTNSSEAEPDDDWVFTSLFNEGSTFCVLFKLAGFENSTQLEYDQHFIKDVQSLASVAATAIGEDPNSWKYASQSEVIKMKTSSDSTFAETLMATVLGRVESAKELIGLVENSHLSEFCKSA